MTIKEYITQRLQAFQITEADFANYVLPEGTTLDSEYTAENADSVNKSLIGIVEWMVFQPHLKGISESGFSIDWDYTQLGKYYLWLCKKYGVTPNADVLALLDLSTIQDRTNIW